MTKSNDLDSKLGILNSMKQDDVKSPKNIPVSVYVQEAENLYHRATKDIEKLAARGLERELVKDLQVRTSALIEAEARWIIAKSSRTEAEADWELKSRQAYEFRNQLIRTFRFAYRKNTGILRRVSGISRGKSHADMIQDLNNLAVLGKKYPDQLSAIKFQPALLDKAAQTSDEMANLLALRSAAREKRVSAIDLRNRAYTHLKHAVDEIYVCGRFVFKGNDLHFSAYSSAYLKFLRQKRKIKHKTETTA